MTRHASGAIKQRLPHFIEKYMETKLNQSKIITGKNPKFYTAYDIDYHTYAHKLRR